MEMHNTTKHSSPEFDAFWEDSLLPVYKSIETNCQHCECVSDNPDLIIGNEIEELRSIAVDLKRKLLFEDANRRYISITAELLKQHGVIHSSVLYAWFKVLAPAALFNEALRILSFSRLICIRLIQNAMKTETLGDALARHGDRVIFDQLEQFEYALTGDSAGLEEYLRAIAGNSAYRMPVSQRHKPSAVTLSEAVETLKTVYFTTKSIPFAFFQSGIPMHGADWSIITHEGESGFDQNGEFVDGRRYAVLTARFDESAEGVANRALNVLTHSLRR